METEFLKKCFGNCLAQALVEFVKIRPNDPIEYLAHWFYHYRKTTMAKENTTEKIQLKEEHYKSFKEAELIDMLKQDKNHIQQKCEKCLKVGRKK
ncbi:PREDICTED: DPY30 domain-containing protein 2-like [Chrysochloris asiatica]|uniref:DPY30 domain-containing protein 2-like n=1 Tax=Chrysochloris asiatica TaxID=185453 RepID=A0A9B0U8C1_CHRAS|nr:PREDICTED: DPY30 domain-containing protein 2-like [Chrysochloris asiatica]